MPAISIIFFPVNGPIAYLDVWVEKTARESTAGSAIAATSHSRVASRG
jgi:hypothetical protein